MTCKTNFIADITTQFDDINLYLYSSGQIMTDVFAAWNGLVTKLDAFTSDILTATFCYFKHMRKFSLRHQVNAFEMDVYM